MSDSDRTRARVLVSGKVQGVYFSGKVQGVYYRANTREQATEHGVDGWVRNLRDGRVEAVFEGAEEDVESMVEWCHEGSPAARVEDVEVEYDDPEGVDDFRIRR